MGISVAGLALAFLGMLVKLAEEMKDEIGYERNEKTNKKAILPREIRVRFC